MVSYSAKYYVLNAKYSINIDIQIDWYSVKNMFQLNNIITKHYVFIKSLLRPTRRTCTNDITFDF